MHKVMSNPSTRLPGMRVFLVEDEFAVQLMLEDMLAMLGCEVAGSASGIAAAMVAAQNLSIDAAVLDINVAGDLVYPVAEILVARKVPLIFSTGYGPSGVAAVWRDWPILQKPFRTEQLACALETASERVKRLEDVERGREGE
jgi:CheY-like chemotaxis protein